MSDLRCERLACHRPLKEPDSTIADHDVPVCSEECGEDLDLHYDLGYVVLEEAESA